MKDKVFIIWSGDNSTALKVKNILENKHNYICYVGGGLYDDSQMLSVGDTVVRQMKICNQAIVIFNNRKDGAVSNNLFFELGFVSARYGMKKVHCVKKSDETIVLPSDFDNSFIESIPATTYEEYAGGIVQYFINRQKLSVDKNKMYLINNRYIIHEMLQAHYSEIGSKCSDYELAQYILFYMQSGVMFQDESKILEELKSFKKHHYNEFSVELHQAANLSIAFLEATSNLAASKDIVYISHDTFRAYFSTCKSLLDEIHVDESGTFAEWAKLILAENLAYVTFLYASNPTINDNMRKQLFQKVIEYATIGLDCVEILENMASSIENNDTVGLISLFKAYLFRHLFNSHRSLNSNDAEKWLKLSLSERQSLLRIFDINSVDTKIYNNFEMEYYLILSEYIDYLKKENIEEFEYMMYLSDIDSFISRYTNGSDVHAYIQKISFFRNHCLT